jgi:simple sugar transport system permease protein
VLPERAADGFALLKDIPFVGPAFFSQNIWVYVALLMIPLVSYFLFKSRWGLVLRAVGESPESANALGYSVVGIRCAALAFSGACIGVAGAYLSLVYTPLWVEGMVAGRGWIALALVTFGTWRPFRVFLGAYLFGGMTMLQMNLQSIGVSIPTQIISMAPYAATIIVLALLSRNPAWIRMNMPASLGKPFIPH